MAQEEKELLLKDLSARVPYGVKIEGYELPCVILNSDWLHFMYTHQEFEIRRPYLRPMSSMSEEEETKIRKINRQFINDLHCPGVFSADDCGCTVIEMAEILNFLNAHHFDYRGLIEKGLALEASEGMYDIKEK